MIYEVGASEVASMVGVGFKSPLAAWLELKYGKEEMTGDHLTFGLKVEPILLDWFKEFQKIEYDAIQPQRKIQVSDNLVIRATPDAVFDGGVVEAKSSMNSSEWVSEPPLKYQIQVQIQMHLFEKTKAFLPVYFFNPTPHLFEVSYDKNVALNFIDQVKEFVNSVDAGIMPVARIGDSELMPKAYPDDGSTVELGEAGKQIVDALKVTRQKKKMQEDQIALLELELKELLGSSSIGTYEGDVICTWKEFKTSRLDQKRISDELPDILEAYAYTSTSRRLVIK